MNNGLLIIMKGEDKMKKTTIICLAAAIIAGVAGDQSLFAESKAAAALSPAKIGLVSVRTVFQNCKKNKDYTDKMNAEKDRVIAELDKLNKEIDAIQADLKTRKPGSDEYLKLLKDMSDKKASLESQKQYFQDQFRVKDQMWTEKMYLEVIGAVNKIAKQKGYDLVLERDEIELPAASATELMLMIRTHKVLYYKEDLDITNEVLAAVDAQQTGTSDDNAAKTAK
jgi:Skp family chaperone for outer membrane proteins